MKVCSKCSVAKPLVEFNKQTKGKGGYRANCKECKFLYDSKYYLENKETIYNRHIGRHYLQQYNLTTEEIKEAKVKQDNKCLICKIETTLQCDHNHVTGKVRGFLCHTCNKALGLFKDNIHNLENAIVYLRNNN